MSIRIKNLPGAAGLRSRVIPPTYNLTSTSYVVDEGMQFNITLNTTNVPNGTLVPYTITGVSSADINNAPLTGNFVVSSTLGVGTSMLSITTTADFLLEGPETFTLTLDNEPTSVQVLINDTSATTLYNNDVVLYINGDGPNGKSNNTFLDSSTNNITITSNNAAQGGFSPFAKDIGKWSTYFDGSSYIQTPNTSEFNFSSSAATFTIEAWINVSDYSSFRGVFGARSNGTSTGWSLYVGVNGAIYMGSLIVGQAYADRQMNTSVLSTGVWNHVALVKDATGYTCYVNGVAGSKLLLSNGLDYQSTQALTIGALASAGEFPFLGSISNARISNSVIYTSNFTPSTNPLSSTVNTLYLTSTGYRFEDFSSTKRSITTVGTPICATESPYSYTEYDSNTSGGSVYFAGNGENLQLSNATALSFGTGDFTVEAWIYPVTSVKTYHPVFECRNSGGSSNPWAFGLYTLAGSYKLDFFYGSSRINSTTPIAINQWTHIAVSRQGTALRAFVNGKLEATQTVSLSINSAGTTQYIGTSLENSSFYANAFISDIRVIKNSAIYTANFTVPQAPLTAVTNTSLLLKSTNAGIVDIAGRNNIKTGGNAAISTTIKKSGTASVYFDGTGDHLQCPISTNFALGSGPFTLEYWIYPTRNTIIEVHADLRVSNTAVPFGIGKTETGLLRSYDGTTVRLGGNMALNQWHHVAWVKNGATNNIYLNGILSITFSNNFSLDGPKTLTIGSNVSIVDQNTQGYIDNIKVVNSVLYTGNFTPQ